MVLNCCCNRRLAKLHFLDNLNGFINNYAQLPISFVLRFNGMSRRNLIEFLLYLYFIIFFKTTILDEIIEHYLT